MKNFGKKIMKFRNNGSKTFMRLNGDVCVGPIIAPCISTKPLQSKIQKYQLT